MKTEAAKIAAIFVGLIISAALQDATPALWGAKIPFLLAFACTAGLSAALAAGFMADALGFAPFGCSTIFFAAASMLLRSWRVPRAAAIPPLAFCHVVWCSVCGAAVELPAAPFAAVLLALPTGFAYAAAVPFVRRLAGIDHRHATEEDRA